MRPSCRHGVIARRGFRLRCATEPLENRLLLSTASYTWQNVNIGAGGFVDGIFYSPTQQNVIYARTDIGGLYKTTNDGTTWQQLLDFVGNGTATSGNGTQQQEIGVLSFAIDPQNPNNLYADVGQYSGTDGDVLYSTNAGASWTATALSFYVGGNSNGRGDGEQIAVDPNDSNIVFLGSNANGLWESTNAGHSFTQITGGNTGLTSTMSTTFVYFDPTTGTSGNPTQRIYLGIDSTGSSSGTNLYLSINGGSSWTKTTGTGTLPSKWIPGHAVLSGGFLYLGYANAEAPNGSITTGGVFRYTPGTSATNGVWANISPQTPGGSNPTFGYDAIAADPQNANTIVVTSFDRYSGPDQIWRTTNGNATTPTWVALYSTAGAQNSGFGGFDPTRNTSSAPWIAAFGDGIGNWAGTVAINPFNSAQIMYGTGQGIWATNNGTSSTTLTAANSWYFPDDGIEFTAALKIVAPQSGLPLFSALGDINGFAHTTLTTSPAAGAIESTITNGGLGTLNSVDFAQSNPNFEAVVGQNGTGGAYTTNDGATWTAFVSDAGSALGGSVAIAEDASAILWAPSGQTPFYSANDGTTWTAATMPSGTLTGGTVVADRVNPLKFYYWTENSSDNSWQLYISTDGGHTFAADGAALGIGNATLIANPTVEGDLWLSTYIGLYHSTNSGSSFAQNGVIAYNAVSSVALGAPAPGKTYPALYIYGDISNFMGVYRSDDGGVTWTQLNDVSHQWGGLIETMAADPNVFGRVYLGINGRGIIMGNPTNLLPAGWSDADINTPGNPGWATDSTTLSTGAIVNQWTVNGGGAGIGGSSDQFNFAFDAVSGNYLAIAQLDSLDNAGSGTPQAGVMFRSSTDANDPFAALVQSTAGQLLFEYRTTTGGSVTTTSLSSIPIGAEYVEIARTGNAFSALYSSDGLHFTQLGSAVTISAMPATADAGLIVTASYNPQLSSAVFSNVTLVPTAFADASGTNTYAIDLNASNSALLQIFVNTLETGTPTYQVAISAVPSLSFSFGSGHDTLTVDFTNGNPTPTGGLAVTAAGSDTIAVAGSGINPLNLSSLTIAAGASLAVQTPANHANRAVMVVSAFSLASTALLDLGGNDLIVHNGNLTQLTGAIAQGFNGGAWNGVVGITSSAAAATSDTALGIEQNFANAQTLFTTFDNQPVASTDVLIKYTYFGDANLDGVVNGSDYTLIDNGLNNKLTGWRNGDFNYDNIVNGDDYTLIDNAFNSQGSPLAVAAPTAQVAESEPNAQLPAASSPPPATPIGNLPPFIIHQSSIIISSDEYLLKPHPHRFYIPVSAVDDL